jgi:hypothetical protein
MDFIWQIVIDLLVVVVVVVAVIIFYELGRDSDLKKFKKKTEIIKYLLVSGGFVALLVLYLGKNCDAETMACYGEITLKEWLHSFVYFFGTIVFSFVLGRDNAKARKLKKILEEARGDKEK